METCLSETGVKEEFYGLVLGATVFSRRCVRKEIKTPLRLILSEQHPGVEGGICMAGTQ